MRNNSHLSVRVFDLAGNHIETITNERFTSGSHKLKWSTQNYDEGIYLVLLSDGIQSVSRKFKVVY